MQTDPLVSLILPIHGEAPFLEETVESITKIRYRNMEVIYVLDRVPELTLGRLQELVSSQKNGIILHSFLPGISNALNFGISKSNGSLISRIDSDDLINPDRISKQVEMIRRNNKIILVGSQMSIIDENGKRIGRTQYPIRNGSIKRLLKVRNCIGHPTVLFSKNEFQKTVGYRSQLDGAEDLDLWIRMSSFGNFVNINEELTNYRISSIQQTNNLKKDPGLMDEAVRISNSSNGEDFLLEMEKISSKSDLRELVDRTFLQISKTNPSLAKSLKASRYLWKFELSFRDKQIRSLYYFISALFIYPVDAFIYTNYAVRIKLFSRRKNDIT